MAAKIRLSVAVGDYEIIRALKEVAFQDIRGIFNIAGPAPVPLSRALSLLGRRTVPLPYSIARHRVRLACAPLEML